MFFYEEMSCPVCERPFTPKDDVVACPHCGLPHHRLCWQREGHCHLQHLHGTDEQWERSRRTDTDEPPKEAASSGDNTRRCPRCGTDNPQYAEFCKRCGNPLGQQEWHSAPTANIYSEYTPFAANNTNDCSYPEGDQIEDIATRDYAAVVGVKADYYIPRFKRLAATNTGGWNWSAFLFGPYWLLYRKMYLGGALLLLLQLFEIVVDGYVRQQLDITTYEQLYQAFATAMNNRTQMFYLLSIWLLSAIILLLHFVIGIAGNRIYKQHCASVIRRSRERVPDISSSELATGGGTSIGVAIIGYFVLYSLSQMTLIFFM